ncbi:succinate dehydrogenase / fumarate reductase, cytochrome b subunit [Patescibacteria group bacterium]|nr:succinate dehydrogenase / fumarate reductase, cytochrome b subunit [Patescibacteria group bacterium]
MNRPTSPHLQEYKLPLTGIISISHRITGVLLSVGLVVVVLMIISVAGGDSAYIAMQTVMNYWLMKILYVGFVFALFFHLCHGIRHLVWDTGHSFEKAALKNYALIELGFALLLTLAALV